MASPPIDSPAQSSRRAWIFIAPFAPAAIVVLFGIIMYIGVRRERETAAWVDHTHRVIERTHDVLARMIDAETGERGFLITGDTASLQPYHGAAADVKKGVADIRQLTTDNPEQQARLDSLAPLVDRRFAVLDSYIALRSSGFDAARVSLARQGDGRAIMDSARVLLGRIEAEESRLLGIRDAERERHANTVLWIVTVGTIAAAAFGLLLNLLLARAAATERRLAQHLDARAKELEVANLQLQDQAAELEVQTEELESQATELEAQAAVADVLTAELQKANEELVKRTAEAEEANWTKSRFLASVSHDLRTPLNAIIGYVELIELGVRGPVNETQRDDLRRIVRSSNHLLSLINDLLNFARIEAGRVEFRFESIRACDVLNEIEPLVVPLVEAKGLDYMHVDCDPDLRVLADREKLDQILINLLTNSIKFTAKGGRIRLHCVVDDANARFEIHDTGRGIPAEKLDVIFDPFIQVGREEGAVRDGIGLGLSISRELARAMNGDIAVTSVLGDGSTFVLRLPRVPAANV